MTVWKCLIRAFDIVKKDSIIWGPYIGFSLLVSLINQQFVSGDNGFSFMEMGVLLFQNCFQSMVGALVILMMYSLKQGAVDTAFSMGVFFKRQAKLLVFAFCINIPNMIMVYFSSVYLSGSAGEVNENILFSLVFLIVGAYVIVPLSAFTYFGLIRYVYRPQSLSAVIGYMFRLCFSEYKLCLRWFWVIILLNSFQIISLPLLAVDFALKNVLISVIQGVLMTLSMVFSVVFYKLYIRPLLSKSNSNKEL